MKIIENRNGTWLIDDNNDMLTMELSASSNVEILETKNNICLVKQEILVNIGYGKHEYRIQYAYFHDGEMVGKWFANDPRIVDSE